MEMKRVVNVLLIAVIAYCFCMWLFFGLSMVFKMNLKSLVVESIIISTLVAIASALLVSAKIRYAKYEVSYKERSSFINKMNHQLEELGFEPRSVKDNKYKYRAFLWFSLIDPKINIRLKSNKAILKGRKRDLENLMNKLNIQQ